MTKAKKIPPPEPLPGDATADISKAFPARRTETSHVIPVGILGEGRTPPLLASVPCHKPRLISRKSASTRDGKPFGAAPARMVPISLHFARSEADKPPSPCSRHRSHIAGQCVNLGAADLAQRHVLHAYKAPFRAGRHSAMTMTHRPCTNMHHLSAQKQKWRGLCAASHWLLFISADCYS